MAVPVTVDSLCGPLSCPLPWETSHRSENPSPGSQMLRVQSIESRIRQVETKHGLPALDSGPVTLCLSFLICELGIIRAHTSVGSCKDKNPVKC